MVDRTSVRNGGSAEHEIRAFARELAVASTPSRASRLRDRLSVDG